MIVTQQALENLLNWNIKPIQIIGDLYRLFHHLWLINWFSRRRKLDDAKGIIKIHPFVFKKYIGYTRKTNQKSLEDGILRIMEADSNLKRGLCRPEEEVRLLTLELVRMISGSGN